MRNFQKVETVALKITPVKKSEYDALIEIWEKSVRATHDFLSENDIQFFKPLIRNQYLGAVDLWCSRVADESIVGFIGISEDSIEMLFLAPDLRGQGIGKALVHHVLKDTKIQKVDVNEQNPGALKFYEKMGFDVVSRSEKDGLGKPFPILHMSLKG
ncbi:MAG: GNAT family N-acetyltransferase [bacterium]|nr:GNAT family N-acetyltransferase [bacterium]